MRYGLVLNEHDWRAYSTVTMDFYIKILKREMAYPFDPIRNQIENTLRTIIIGELN